MAKFPLSGASGSKYRPTKDGQSYYNGETLIINDFSDTFSSFNKKPISSSDSFDKPSSSGSTVIIQGKPTFNTPNLVSGQVSFTSNNNDNNNNNVEEHMPWTGYGVPEDTNDNIDFDTGDSNDQSGTDNDVANDTSEDTDETFPSDGEDIEVDDSSVPEVHPPVPDQLPNTIDEPLDENEANEEEKGEHDSIPPKETKPIDIVDDFLDDIEFTQIDDIGSESDIPIDVLPAQNPGQQTSFVLLEPVEQTVVEDQ